MIERVKPGDDITATKQNQIIDICNLYVGKHGANSDGNTEPKIDQRFMNVGIKNAVSQTNPDESATLSSFYTVYIGSHDALIDNFSTEANWVMRNLRSYNGSELIDILNFQDDFDSGLGWVDTKIPTYYKNIRLVWLKTLGSENVDVLIYPENTVDDISEYDEHIRLKTVTLAELKTQAISQTQSQKEHYVHDFCSDYRIPGDADFPGLSSYSVETYVDDNANTTFQLYNFRQNYHDEFNASADMVVRLKTNSGLEVQYMPLSALSASANICADSEIQTLYQKSVDKIHDDDSGSDYFQLHNFEKNDRIVSSDLSVAGDYDVVLRYNGSPREVKYTDVANLLGGGGIGVISGIYDFRFDLETHQLQVKRFTFDCATGVQNIGDWTMVTNGQAYPHSQEVNP